MKKLKPIYLIILAFVLLWGVIFGRWALRSAAAAKIRREAQTQAEALFSVFSLEVDGAAYTVQPRVVRLSLSDAARLEHERTAYPVTVEAALCGNGPLDGTSFFLPGCFACRRNGDRIDFDVYAPFVDDWTYRLFQALTCRMDPAPDGDTVSLDPDRNVSRVLRETEGSFQSIRGSGTADYVRVYRDQARGRDIRYTCHVEAADGWRQLNGIFVRNSIVMTVTIL